MTNVEDSVKYLGVAIGVLLVVSLVTVTLRRYFRIWLVKAFGWDDEAMILEMNVYQRIIYTIAILSGLLAIKGTIVQLVQCRPIDYFWTLFEPETAGDGTCFSPETYRALTYVYDSLADTSDLVLGSLPVSSCASCAKKKNQPAVILGLVGIASIALLVRLAYTGQYGGLDMSYDVNFAI
ncbi:hypothetical protein BDV12DRAFT_202432 [Aspergillus spectabilis]